MKITNKIQSVMAPPVSLANALKAQCPEDLALLDFSQAVPGYPPPPGLVADAQTKILQPESHKYAPALGLPDLREAYAAAQQVAAGNIAITAGCNQAFAVAMQCLAQAGRKVILPTPYYFNHQMTLTMQGFEIVPWPCRDDMSLDFDALPGLLGPDVCAVVLVSPNNPTGAVTPPDTIQQLLETCEQAGCHLVLDETYRDFVDPKQRVGSLDSPWLIQLYSFSKAYSIAGHRVGAMTADTRIIAQAEKVIDCWAICAPRIGQMMALWGLSNAQEWLDDWRDRIVQRESHLTRELNRLDEIELVCSGAYFAWLRIDGDQSSVEVSENWIRKHGILALPAAYFGSNQRAVRLAFANQDEQGISQFVDRLSH